MSTILRQHHKKLWKILLILVIILYLVLSRYFNNNHHKKVMLTLPGLFLFSLKIASFCFRFSAAEKETSRQAAGKGKAQYAQDAGGSHLIPRNQKSRCEQRETQSRCAQQRKDQALFSSRSCRTGKERAEKAQRRADISEHGGAYAMRADHACGQEACG